MPAFRSILLATGFVAPLVYVATVLAGGWATPGYDHVSQPVSALFETGAPHALAVSLAFVGYNILLVAFGLGLHLVWRDADIWRRLTAWAILLNGAFGLLIELAPMDPVGAPATLPGTVHLVLAGLLVVTCMAAMALMVVSWRRRRTHARSSGITVGLLILMVGAGALAAGAATAGWPWLGVFQRLTIGSYLVWLPMLAAIARSERQ